MVLSSVSLKNFRIHKENHIIFSDQLNYIVGGNGLGKTSILEAIYYICTTKGFSSRSDAEAVNFGEDNFEISGNIRDYTEERVRVYFSNAENRKHYFRNEKQVFRSAEVIGKFPVVILAPSDHTITQGAPGERRKFVDSIISQASETYLKTLLDYNKTLRQRGVLLVKLKEGRSKILLDELEAWTQKLVMTGIILIEHRIKFTQEFNTFIKESYQSIMEGDENPDIEYINLEGTGDIRERFIKTIDKRREEEIRRGQNLVGPHRDDFIFSLNGVNLKMYGSQGQHKTFQVALRFAQFFYLKEITGKVPLFLLDDVFGELDAARSARISSYLRKVGQAFITLTDLANFSFLTFTDTDKIIKLNKEGMSYA
jgi:DNA replication and repair protein RecF